MRIDIVVLVLVENLIAGDAIEGAEGEGVTAEEALV